MARKLAGILLALILSAAATVTAVMLLNDNEEKSGTEAGTTQTGDTTTSGSTSSGGSTGGSGSGSGTGSGSSSSGGSTGSSGSTAAHNCEYVYKTTVEAGCFTQGYTLYECKVEGCGKTEKRNYTNPHESHDYVWTETAPATCSTEGEETGICSRCGDKSTNSITTLDHEYGEYKANGDATCGKDGTKTAKCKVCGESSTKTDVGTATGEHVYGAYKTNGDGTCIKEGTATATCATCGAKDTKTGVKGDHDYEMTLVKDMCDSREERGVCKLCGELSVLATQTTCVHSPDVKWTETKNATCSEEGYRRGNCSVCGHACFELIKKTQHSYGDDGRCKICQDCKNKIFIFPSDAVGEEVFGTVYFEFVLINPQNKQTSYGGWIMRYDLYVVQKYTVGGQEKLVRTKITLDRPDEVGSTFKMKLLRLTDNYTLEFDCVADYSVDAESRWIILKLWGSGEVNLIKYTFDTGREFEY